MEETKLKFYKTTEVLHGTAPSVLKKKYLCNIESGEKKF
jgi:hypothetical protein